MSSDGSPRWSWWERLRRQAGSVLADRSLAETDRDGDRSTRSAAGVSGGDRGRDLGLDRGLDRSNRARQVFGDLGRSIDETSWFGGAEEPIESETQAQGQTEDDRRGSWAESTWPSPSQESGQEPGQAPGPVDRWPSARSNMRSNAARATEPRPADRPPPARRFGSIDRPDPTRDRGWPPDGDRPGLNRLNQPFDLTAYRAQRSQPRLTPRPVRSRSWGQQVGQWLDDHSPTRPGRWPDPRRARPTGLRVVVVGGLLLAGLGAIALRLVILQVVQGPDLAARARAQQRLSVTPFVPRRPIVDRQGTVLAMDRLTYTLYAHPKQFQKTIGAIAVDLGPALRQEPGVVLKRLTGAKGAVKLVDRLPEDQAEAVRRLGLNGLELVEQPSRVYPQRDLAAEIIGYTDFERRGRSGLEASLQSLLERSSQAIALERGAGGFVLAQAKPGQAVTGQLAYPDRLELQLTLDTRLQRAARSVLRETMERWKPKKGAIALMEARTGAILALACEPTFDPNRYFEADVAAFRNWFASDLYEPGSTFKPLVMALALEAGAVSPTDRFLDPGAIAIGNKVIANANKQAHGEIGPEQILQTSSNVGMVRVVDQLSDRLGSGALYDGLERLGVGKTSGSDLPGEAQGQLRSREVLAKSRIDRATAAFGQGFSITPLQLLRMMAALANGGWLVTPHVIEGFSADHRLYWQPERAKPERIFSTATSQQIVAWMEAVLKPGGTATQAAIEGYRIAGKTGTSQKSDPTNGYRPGARVASFAAIVPANDPRYVVLAVFDEPVGGSGGLVAAPAVKSFVEALLVMEGIAPIESPKPPRP